jgi:hypothetical protein
VTGTGVFCIGSMTRMPNMGREQSCHRHSRMRPSLPDRYCNELCAVPMQIGEWATTDLEIGVLYCARLAMLRCRG